MTNLARTLQLADIEHRFVFFMSKGESHILNIQRSNFSIVEIDNSTDSYRRIFAEHCFLPFLIRKHQIDIMYFPGNFSSFYCPVPYVLAIRSMLPFNPKLKSAVNWSRNFYRKFLYPRSAKRARHIITPSLHTKNEIVEYLNVHPDKVSVIPHGIDNEVFGAKKDPDSAFLIFEKFGVKLPFILYVSALWEYKNQDKLIQAFSKLVRNKKIPHTLILVGRGMNSYESYGAKLKLMVDSLDLSKQIIFIDFLPHDSLKHFYQHSDVFVFPSEMESFGNSIFEAMAAETPVICSNTHGFPTMLGNAALLVNPNDIDALSDAIFLVLKNQEIKNNLVSHGKSLANSLSWPSCIEKTLSVILDNPI